jgi:thiamine kinase-like enzyme
LAQERSWPAVVVAKTYCDDKGQNAYDAMQALWQSPLSASRTVGIAEPLAYLPELNVLVQGPLREECTLKELIRHSLRNPDRAGGVIEYRVSSIEDSPTCNTQYSIPNTQYGSGGLANYICKTAAGLAELHQCGVHYGERVTWEDELAKIYKQRAKLAKPLPQLANLAEDLLDRLKKLAATHPADAMVPTHRSFRPAQVLLSGGEIGFIDFDGFCQAEPALDLALFMTTVRNLGVNKSDVEDEDEEEGEQVDTEKRWRQAEAICQLFLTEYEKHAPVSLARLLLWETIYLLSLVLSSWSKLKLARLDNCLFMLERHLMVNDQWLLVNG